ncbi:L,D-transpeptidase family protein [Thalassotalea atypica]|uniref:L,D-transpeptidase family protein n=1 Tax=Thalassotalea atypica TaxID=2054316 RepID=UPI002573A816|nr:L,D-transpeptidase family protein [Thalassotalea atypica]
MRASVYLAAMCVVLSLTQVQAIEYELPRSGKRLLGEPVQHTVVKGDYFQAIAELYDIGFLALMAANKGIDPFLPPIGHKLNIPTQLLLPFVARVGLVINLPELRMYYFLPNEQRVHVFPVGIGRLGLETPITTSYIGEKRINPVWRPTEALKQRYQQQNGVALADEVPAGANNPFGKYAMRIGTSEYLIHGTNKRFGIGMRVSSGCIRMYDDDIKWLFENVPINTPIKIIDQPIKMSYEQENLKLIEMHQPLSIEHNTRNYIEQNNVLHRFIEGHELDREMLATEFHAPSGLVKTLAQK